MVFQKLCAISAYERVRKSDAETSRSLAVPRAEIAARAARNSQAPRHRGVTRQEAGKLSVAQRQRVALGRAIIRQPAAFLMDEPLSNLDVKLREHMRTEI